MTETPPVYIVDEKLAGMVTQVANSRRWLREQEATVAKLRERLEATPEFAEYIAAHEVLNGIKDDAERQERELKWEAAFHYNGDSKPHPAITMRREKVSEFDPVSALTWSIEYGINTAIKLDGTAFKKEANAVMQMTSVTDMKEALMQFYKVKIVPRATLATDLTPFESTEEQDND